MPSLQLLKKVEKQLVLPSLVPQNTSREVEDGGRKADITTTASGSNRRTLSLDSFKKMTMTEPLAIQISIPTSGTERRDSGRSVAKDLKGCSWSATDERLGGQDGHNRCLGKSGFSQHRWYQDGDDWSAALGMLCVELKRVSCDESYSEHKARSMMMPVSQPVQSPHEVGIIQGFQPNASPSPQHSGSTTHPVYALHKLVNFRFQENGHTSDDLTPESHRRHLAHLSNDRVPPIAACKVHRSDPVTPLRKDEQVSACPGKRRDPSSKSPDARRQGQQGPIQPGGKADSPSASSFPLWSAPLTDILRKKAKSLQCPELGIRFTVQDSRFGNSNPTGNFEVKTSMIVETFNGKGYFAGEMAFCHTNGSPFSRPLLVDFFLKPGSPSLRRKRELDQVLTDSQVLYKENPRDEWKSVPRNKVRLVKLPRGEKRETYVQAEVRRFYSIGLFRLADTNNRFSFGLQRNEEQLVIRNISSATMYIVVMPAMLNDKGTTPVEIKYGSRFPESGDDCSGGLINKTEEVKIPSGLHPSCQIFAPNERHKFDMKKLGDYVRLVMCTLEELPGGQGQEGAELRTLRVWDSLNAYGGRDIAILPSFDRGEWQSSVIVDTKDKTNLWRVVLTLDGIFAPTAV